MAHKNAAPQRCEIHAYIDSKSKAVNQWAKTKSRNSSEIT